MKHLSLDEIEAFSLAALARQRHQELTGHALGFFDFPCLEAIYYAMEARRESEQAVINLLNDA